MSHTLFQHVQYLSFQTYPHPKKVPFYTEVDKVKINCPGFFEVENGGLLLDRSVYFVSFTPVHILERWSETTVNCTTLA